jgi:hypothetical protein
MHPPSARRTVERQQPKETNMSKVSLTSHQLDALDRLIMRGKDISVDELPGGKLGPQCWLDCAVSTAVVVTMVAGCIGAAYTAQAAKGGGSNVYTVDQLKDLRYRATQI